MFWCLICLCFVQFSCFGPGFCTITTNDNGYYIGVYDDSATYSWFEAKKYCMTYYGSSLASVHSSTDETNLEDARVNTGVSSWTGLNDIDEESIALDYTVNAGWAWSDGSDYDYVVEWATSEPNNVYGGQDCGQLYSAGTWDDAGCEYGLSQFLCNLNENWRPIFKISSNLADYGGESSSYLFWMNGESNYDNYYNDVNFVENSFNASNIDTDYNYRSLVIDDWEYLFDNGGFDKVKVSLYANGSEVRYFVYHATNDSSSWFSQSNIISSSYRDTGYETSNIWDLYGDSARYFMAWRNYGGCAADAGWMLITESDPGCADWVPGETDNGNPEIRYSTNYSTEGLLLYGQMADGTQNARADTMVIYLNGDDTSSFGKTFINTSSSGEYINIYLPYENYNWFEAKDYCMTNYGSSLASVHSLDDENELLASRYDSSLWTWVGFNDINEESVTLLTEITSNTTWQWSDGTSFDYAISWGGGQPDDAGDNEDCGMYYPGTTGANDYLCTNTLQQFICNKEENWRPILKINGNISDYNGAQNASDFWFNNDASTYDSYTNDIDYILNTFNASTWDTVNYRSLAINDWNLHFTRGKFDKVKVGIYKDGEEAKYFVYNATSDDGSWYSQDNLIDSSYYNTKFSTYNLWSINMNAYARYWIVWQSYGGCSNDQGWFIVTEHNSGSCSAWVPSEGIIVPQIRYSINYTADGKPIDGQMDDSNENAIADAFVVYINVDDSTTFGLTNEPTQMPTDVPSYNPTSQPTTEPSNDPTKMPSNEPSFNPSSEPSMEPSSEPSLNPSDIPSSEPSGEPTAVPTIEPSDPSMSPTNVPSSNPSGIPTEMPSTEPSEDPSKAPSITPTMEPSAEPIGHEFTTTNEDTNNNNNNDMSTTEEDSNTNGDGDNDSSNNDSSTSNDNTVEVLTNWLIIFGVVMLVGCIFCGLLIIFLHRRSDKKLKKAVYSLHNINSGTSDENDNDNNNNNNNNNISSMRQDTIQSTTGFLSNTNDNNGENKDKAIALEMITMPPQPKVSSMNVHMGNTAGGPIGNDTGGIGGAGGAHGEGGHAAGDSDDNLYDAHGNNDDDDIMNVSPMGPPGHGAQNTSNNGGGEGGGGGSGAYATGSVMNIGGRQLELHKDWNKWNAKDVNTWLFGELKNAGFENEIVNNFMKEFEEIHMTGRLLQGWLAESNGNSDVLTKKLQSKVEFSKKSMVWDVIVQAIMNL